MAKAPAADSIMSPEKMKPLLALSKRVPVQAAIGLTGDGEALVLLDKKAKPKKVLSMLRTSASKAKLQLNGASLRFGRAEVDTDYDSSMVRFFVNKETPGNMRVRLVELVKRIPYQKVEINVDPSLEEEGEDDEQAQETVSAANALPPAAEQLDAAALTHELAALIGRIPAAAGDDAARRAQLAQLAGEANGTLKAKDLPAASVAIARLSEALEFPAATQDAVPLDADALKRELAALIGRIAQVTANDPARKAQSMQHAADANGKLKANDLAAAAASIAQLRELLDATGAVAPAGNDAIQLWRSARQAWQAASDAVDKQISSLQSALLTTGHDMLKQIAESGLNGVTGDNKVPLLAAISDIGSGDGDKLEKGRPKALKAVRAFRSHLAGDIRIAACDENPFGVTVSIRATLGGALAQMEAALQA